MDGPASILYRCANVDAMDDAHTGICSLADEYHMDTILDPQLSIDGWRMVDT